MNKFPSPTRNICFGISMYMSIKLRIITNIVNNFFFKFDGNILETTETTIIQSINIESYSQTLHCHIILNNSRCEIP